MKYSHFKGLLFIGLSVAGGTSGAAITAPETIDFSGTFAAALYGKANLDPTTAEGCGQPGKPCYTQGDFTVGAVFDPNGLGSHLHRIGGTAATRTLEYHQDSAGIYLRANDFSSFSVNSFQADTRYTADSNPNTGLSSSYYEVLGFNTALNDKISTWDWAADPTYGGKLAAYQTFQNLDGINTIALDPSKGFNNISALWIHYVGYPNTPSDTDPVLWNVKIDNIQLDAPAAVPVPAAVYLFGTGLMGFLAVGKRRRTI